MAVTTSTLRSGSLSATPPPYLSFPPCPGILDSYTTDDNAGHAQKRKLPYLQEVPKALVNIYLQIVMGVVLFLGLGYSMCVFLFLFVMYQNILQEKNPILQTFSDATIQLV